MSRYASRIPCRLALLRQTRHPSHYGQQLASRLKNSDVATSVLFSKIPEVAQLGACYGSLPEPFEPDDFRTYVRLNDYNGLGIREGWRLEPSPPPQTIREPETRPPTGPFFFWFQRGLAAATALRRLVKCQKSVSEPALSLTDRPWPSEGRIQKV